MSAGFAFTIADVDTSEDNLDTTMAMLSFVSEPQVEEKRKRKLLIRPPFRFLHDLISPIMRHSKYRPNLFTGDDLKFETFRRHKWRKINYLEKIRDAVSADMDTEIVLNPNKVCAGKLCHETRTFLQYLALAAHHEGDRIRVMKSRRQWLRAIWRSDFHPTSIIEQYATEQLLQFFNTFPGLRRLVGKLVSLYVQPGCNLTTAELLTKHNKGPPPPSPPSPSTTTTTTTTTITTEDEEGELFINKLS